MGRIFAKIEAIKGVRIANIRQVPITAPVQNLAAIAACVSVVTATLSVAKPLQATAFVTSGASANLSLPFAASATANANSVVFASLTVSKPLQAVVTVTSGATATLSTGNTLSATVPATSTVTANLSVEKPLAAVVSVLSSTTANPTIGKPLQATIPVTSSTGASLSVSKPLQATANVNSSTTADLTVSSTQSLSATVSTGSTATATLTLVKNLSGSVSANSTTAGDLTIGKPLAATVSATSSTSADLTTSTTQSLSGTVAATSGTTATLSVSKPLAATVAAVSGTSANLAAYDSITAAYVARLTGSYTTTQTDKLDTFVRALRTAEIHNQFEFLHLYGWAATQSDALLNLFENANNSTVVGTGGVTFTAGQGIRTGTASALDTNFSLSSGTKFTQNANTFGVWVPSGRTAANDGQDLSASTGSSYASAVQYRFTGDVHRTRNNDTSATNSNGLTATFAVCKMVASRRTSSSSIQLIRDGVSIASSSVTSTTRPSLSFHLGSRNFNGTPSLFSNELYSADWAGAAFSDTQYNDFYNAMNTLFS